MNDNIRDIRDRMLIIPEAGHFGQISANDNQVHWENGNGIAEHSNDAVS